MEGRRGGGAFPHFFLFVVLVGSKKYGKSENRSEMTRNHHGVDNVCCLNCSGAGK